MKGLLFLLIIILIVTGTGIFLYLQLRVDPVSEAVKKGEPIQVLMTFHDQGTLLFSEVLVYHPGTTKAALFDIPPDVGMLIESAERIDRIDLLFDPHKIQPYKEKVEKLLDQPIRFYFVLDKPELEQLIDLLGGVDMFIANPVDIVEEERIVLLPSGSLVLDGRKSTDFVVYSEEGESAVEWIGRRQRLIQAMLRGFGQESAILTHPKVFPTVRRLVDTDMGKAALLSFIEEMTRLDSERIVFQRVLGVKRKVDENVLLFPHSEGNWLKKTVVQTLDSIASMDVVSVEDLNVSVEILNGTDRGGLASRTATIFESFGYEIGLVGNADSFDYEKTVVVYHGGDLLQAQKTANIIKCTNITNRHENLDGDQRLLEQSIDITIILGTDFDGRYCK
jgi:polyisoprenyl-teichoic acid--peptidoglycan teichoic acid transferase